MIDAIASYLSTLFGATVRQGVLVFGLLFALGTLVFLLQRWTQQLMAQAVGWRGVVYWTGWLGTPVHEASHWLVGTLCGIKIQEVKLFEPDPKSGVLGYVRYSVPRLRPKELHKVVGTFLMGVAPLFGGSLVLLLALWALTPAEHSRLVFQQAEAFSLGTTAPDATAGSVFQGFVRVIQAVYGAVVHSGPLQMVLFLYLALAIGNHLAPSRADLEGGLVGLLTLLGLVLVLNALLLLFGGDPVELGRRLARGSGTVSALLVLALVINCGNLALAFLASWVADKVRLRQARRRAAA